MKQPKIILACTLLLSVVAVPTVAASQNGQTVVVAEGETVKGLSATAERVVVRVTVDGNLRAQAASVVVAVTGLGAIVMAARGHASALRE